MPPFVRFLFFLIVRIVITFGVLGFIIFLLWGVMYLAFVE